MAVHNDTWGTRRWLGPGLLVAVVLIGGAFLEFTVDDPAEEWFLRGFLVVGILSVASYVFFVWLHARSTARQLRELEASYDHQCEALTASLDEMRHGELVAAVERDEELPEEMRQTLLATSSSLAALVQQIQATSVEVATSASGVRSTAAALASGSSQQAAAVVQITSTMEELARTAGQIAANAATQAELAAHSEQAGDEGAQALQSAVAGLEATLGRIEGISERADSLGSRSREIYQILDLITEIARETHILSLNAAIEAAAAGERGERFSAVAEEVRRLAERSRESVDSVRSLLDEFSGAIRAVVVATEEGGKTARGVLDQARASQGSVAQLREALSETAGAAREISLATEEQRTASDQVVVTLREVSEVIQRMADGLQQFTGAAEQLSQLALSIQLLTQSFRLDSHHSLKNLAIQWADRLSDYGGNLEAVEGVLKNLVQECPFLELVYLVDITGTMVSFVINRDLAGADATDTVVGVGESFGDRPWFRAVARDGRPVVTTVYDSLLTGDKCFTVAAAVHDVDGVVSGTLGMDVNTHNWTSI